MTILHINIKQWWIVTGLSLMNGNDMVLHMDYHWMTYLSGSQRITFL